MQEQPKIIPFYINFRCSKLMEQKVDIFIKDEGHLHVRLHDSRKAKEWCYKNGYNNGLVKFGDTYCGETVWKPESATHGRGMYSFFLSHNKVNEFINKATEAGLVVYSEI